MLDKLKPFIFAVCTGPACIPTVFGRYPEILTDHIDERGRNFWQWVRETYPTAAGLTDQEMTDHMVEKWGCTPLQGTLH